MAKSYNWHYHVDYVAKDGGVDKSIKRLNYRIDVVDSEDDPMAWVNHIAGTIEINDNSLSLDSATTADCKALVLADLGISESAVQTKLDNIRSANHLHGVVT